MNDVRNRALHVAAHFGVGFRHRKKSAHRIFVPLVAVLDAHVHFQRIFQRRNLPAHAEKFLIEIIDGQLHIADFFFPLRQLLFAARGKLFQFFQVFPHAFQLFVQFFAARVFLLQRGFQFGDSVLRRLLLRRKRTLIFPDFRKVFRRGKLALPIFVGKPFEHVDFTRQRLDRLR